MKAIRIGNDIVIRWKIFKDGEPAELSDINRISIILSCRGEERRINDYIIDGNTIILTFWGRDQKHTGTYRLTYLENEGLQGMHTVDACDAFILVDSSIKVSGETNYSNIDVATVNITSDFSAPSNGLSAYEIALKHGFKGTEEEWLESLHVSDGVSSDIEIIDSVSTSFTDKALSANQGKILNKKIEEESNARATSINAISQTLDDRLNIVDNNLNELDKKIIAKSSVGLIDKYHRGRVKRIVLKATYDGVDTLPDSLPRINIAPIKYNKDIVLSLTVDDCHATAFCNIWAAINGRPVAANQEGGNSKTYFYHANQYLEGDIPADIKGKTYDRILYSDGLGGQRRFNYGIAVWPSAKTPAGIFQMDSVSAVDKNAGNLYRFMSPYLTWTDYELLKRYGVDIYQHNIGEEEYGSDKIVYNVINGIIADSLTAYGKSGRFISAVMEPDGNKVYCEAGEQIKLIDVIYNQSTGVDMVPYEVVDMRKKTYKRYFDTADSVKSKIETLLSKDISERTWYHFCFHSVYDNTCDLFHYIQQTFGDSIWFASAQEVYEYQYMKKWAVIKSITHKIENGQYVVTCEVHLPFQDNFTHRDASINFSLPVSANLLNVECTSGDIPELEFAMTTENEATVHIGVNEDIIDNVEYFVGKYESTHDDSWKEDALIDISRLREDLRQQYIDRLNAEPVAITAIQITLDTFSIDKGDTITGTVTATPSNNTQMSAILLNVSGGARISSKAIFGNTIHFTVIGETSGAAEITAGIGDISDTTILTINEVQAPAEQVVVSNLSISPSSPNVGDEIEVSWAAAKGGSSLIGGYIKIWTNLTSMPDVWTSVSGSSYKMNAEESLTSIFVKVATDADGSDASDTSVCEVQVSSPVETGQVPVYMFSFTTGGVGNSNWHRYDSVFGHHINTLYTWGSASLGSEGPVDANGNATSLRPMSTALLQSSDCVTRLLSLHSATWSIGGNMNESYSKIMTLFDETTNALGAERAKYAYAYGNDTLCAIGWNLDNGKYKVRLLSTYDSYTNDPYASCNYQTPGLGKIYLNSEDVTSRLGASVVSFANNTIWSDPVEVEVTGGELIVSLFNKKTSVAAERTRMNLWGIEITKLS